MTLASKLLAAFVIAAPALAAWGCGDPAAPPEASGSTGSGPSRVGSGTAPAAGGPAAPAKDRARQGSSVARYEPGGLVVVADEDHKALQLVELPVERETKAVKFEPPGTPAQIVSLGKRLLVTVRDDGDGDGALLVYEKKDGLDLTEVARVELPADAWGIATSPAGTHALVTSAWTAKVSLVDLTTNKVVWTRDVAREPRGVVFTPDGDSAYVSHLIDAPLTRIDKIGSEATVSRVPFPASPLRSAANERLSASLGYSLVLSPEGDRLYAPRHALGTLGIRTWFGAAAVDVLDLATQKNIATPRGGNAHVSMIEPLMPRDGREGLSTWWSAASTIVEEGNSAFIQPRAAVYRKSQRSILVASEGTDAIVELDAMMQDPTLGLIRSYSTLSDSDRIMGVAVQGGAPSGIALSEDEGTAYVYCRTTDELAVVRLVEGDGYYETVPPRYVKLAEDPKDPMFAFGRKLFYNATDYTVSGGLACAGCHPEGRDDGYVWHEVEFSNEGKPNGGKFSNFFGSASAARHMDAFWHAKEPRKTNIDKTGAGYARQTPMLAGRLKAKGPYGWLAENKDLSARLVAGFRLHRWEGPGIDEKEVTTGARINHLSVFVRAGLTPPPMKKRDLSDEEKRGKEIFMSEAAACSSCHAPESDYTNRSVAVIPGNVPRQAFVEEKNAAYKTPSLLFVGGSAPYFHDGRYETLEELIEKNGDRMGKTSHLSPEDRKALVAFLRTL
jgi:DNA-binding beta-propeller fold protein YncE